MNTLNYNHLQSFQNPGEILELYFSGLLSRNKKKYESFIFAIKFLARVIEKIPGTMKN
jgi:hypothetical protein